ncbi:Uncharacterized protein FWK35_00034582, partial [Aphis craccivora]
ALADNLGLNINISKCRSTSFFRIQSSIELNNYNRLKALSCAINRSILEHAVVVWDPNTTISINQIESIQLNFLSFAAWVLYQLLKLSSLVDRLAKLSITSNFHHQIFLQSIHMLRMMSIANKDTTTFEY